MAIELHHLHPSHDDEVTRLKERIAELEAERDAFEKSFNEMSEAYMKSQRALWLARAEICHRFDVDRYLRNHRNSWYNENCLNWADACVAMEVKMCKAESKCRAKAEEYK